MRTEMSFDSIDLAPSPDRFHRDVLTGLSRPQKMIDSKFLYDRRGSELFELICDVPEYYPTRTECSILRSFGAEIGEALKGRCLLIEPGSGSPTKLRLLRPHLEIAAYVPIEISAAMLRLSTQQLQAMDPELRVLPICADFTQPIQLPELHDVRPSRRVIFFPGSTIGNFHPPDAVRLLTHFGNLVGPGGGLLIGVDRRKPREHFLRAYDDEAGVTAAFNLNLLQRLNREVGADFKPQTFSHQVIYNDALARVEMHLRSEITQVVRVCGTPFSFQEGETIHTECSYKYAPGDFVALAAKAGFILNHSWTDSEKLFSVYYLCQGDGGSRDRSSQMTVF